MRQVPSRYAMPKPANVKPNPSRVEHVSAPLKGLNLSSKLTTGDPLTAPILVNFVVEDDRITCRAGTKKIATVTAPAPVECLIPYYGSGGQKLLAASGHRLALASDGSIVKSGFTSDDWSWSSFVNLGSSEFTVMCNGHDGVWSWDGGLRADPAAVPVTSLSNANPAVCTVSAGNIGLFLNGATVFIAGAAGTGMTAANGYHIISTIGAPANSFKLLGVDTSVATAPQTTGVTADAPGSIAKENITAPPTAPWVVPDQFNIVMPHMNRLFFADGSNLCLYYLPIQQKSGEVKVLPVNQLFRRGGNIRALYSWTLEGGIGINDQLCVFSSNGEMAIFSGVDPDTDFQLVGVFRFDSPMSKNSIANFGGELYVLISTGLVPMSTLLRAESEQLGQVDRAVISLFLSEAIKYRDRSGWQVFLNPSTNRLFANIPQGHSNGYTQMIRHMPRPVWSQYQDLPARCWAWVDPYVYFGDDLGNIYQMHPDYLNDNGAPIRVDVQMSWSLFKTPGIKHFKMLRTYMITDGTIQPFVDIKVDYDLTPPTNQPDVSIAAPGSEWDLADWDTSDWATGAMPAQLWNGVASLGRVGAPRLTALIYNTKFSITGWDVLFEQGAAI